MNVKVGYVTTYDPTDIDNWSGLGVVIGQSLVASGLEVEFLGPLEDPRSLPLFAKRALHRFIVGGDYLWERSAIVGRAYAGEIARRLRSIEIDAVLIPGSIPVAFLAIPQPVAFWTDATFAAIRDFYPDYFNLAPNSIR